MLFSGEVESVNKNDNKEVCKSRRWVPSNQDCQQTEILLVELIAGLLKFKPPVKGLFNTGAFKNRRGCSQLTLPWQASSLPRI